MSRQHGNDDDNNYVELEGLTPDCPELAVKSWVR